MHDGELGPVVDYLYEAAVRPELWLPALDRLASASNALGAQMLDHRPEGAALHTVSSGLEEISVAIGGTTGDLPTDVITFTFVSDTSDVQPFTLGPVHGFENLVGTASITVTDYSTGSVVAQGAFLPSDGIFVSIDNVNGGVGFGSDGASPSDPGFPGNPAYPFALVPDDDPAVFTYDLQSNIAFNSLSSLSCLGFPGACNAPTALATTAGYLVLGAAGDQFGVVDIGEFTANVTSNTTPVPEPATWALMATGLAALGFRRRKGLRLFSATA